MAASEILVKSGTPIPVTMTSLAGLVTSTTSGGAQSLKTDLGATRAQQMLVRLQTAFTTAAVAGGAVEVYVGFSSQSTAASGNVVALSGADAAWTGYGNDVSFANSTADLRRFAERIGYREHDSLPNL